MNGVETRRWIPRERGFQKKKENNDDEKCKKNEKILRLKKDNCFRNFFNEVLKILKDKKYNFYYDRMSNDITFRSNLIKKLSN